MKKVYDDCCGIDTHKKLIVACFKHSSRQEIREFGATTRELLEMADWLKEGGCQMVAMESTASYWKPLYNILESCGLDAMVVNAHHMKAVPGRKTDVKDAEWIADLLQHGLLTASYIPDKDQRELRELVRYRKSLVGERNRELNRLQKMLEGANIKISGTITDINGKSARNLVEHLLSGKQIDSAEYDVLYEKKIIAHNLKATKEQIIDDLNGVMSGLQRKKMRILLNHLDELNHHIDELDKDIDSFMKPEEKKAAAAIQEISKEIKSAWLGGSCSCRIDLSVKFKKSLKLVFLNEGYEWIVDIDLEKFFDNVPQDKLMSFVHNIINEGDTESLIRKYMKAGVMIQGRYEKTEQGSPEGGNLSPLISNIMLNELDRELENRGLRFVRYTDDCVIAVRSEAGVRRVM